MTTKVTIDAHAGWRVRVIATDTGYERIVPANEVGDFYLHSGCDLIVHEVQPDEAPRQPRDGQSFGTALFFLKIGKKVRRKGWNGKGMFLFLVNGSTFKVNRAPLLGIYPEGTKINYRPHIDMKTVDGEIVPWVASQTDILAEDWEIVG